MFKLIKILFLQYIVVIRKIYLLLRYLLNKIMLLLILSNNMKWNITDGNILYVRVNYFRVKIFDTFLVTLVSLAQFIKTKLFYS